MFYMTIIFKTDAELENIQSMYKGLKKKKLNVKRGRWYQEER